MFPEQLRGMFGIAVWDQTRRRGVVARDRLGIKPIYYAVCGDLLVFASELKSLLASGLVPTDLDYEAIDAYLTLGFFPAPRDAARGGEEARAGLRPRGRGRRASSSGATGATRSRRSSAAAASRSGASGCSRSSRSRSGCG